MKIVKHLNPKQKQAVTTINGPVLILAGPGSGKTRVLTHRIAYLISQGVKPENILAVTFTNKAAGEMKQRVTDLINDQSLNKSSAFIGTFHAFCLRILKKEINKLGFKNDFVIYDESDQLSLVKKIIKDLEIDKQQFRPGLISNKISTFKSELVDDQQFKQAADNYFQQTIANIYEQYQQKLKQLNALDFDDLIMKAVELFNKFPNVLAKYQEKYKYILIDEYQDTNTAQYELINQLAQRRKNICVVGDDSQSIYKFRRADFRNILNFENDYPQAKTIVLEQNYRSTQNILDTARKIISRNKHQKQKKLWTKNNSGKPITIAEADNEIEEAEFIIDEIKKLSQQLSLNWKQFVILYRTNAQSRALEERLIKHNLPYKIVGGIKFYQRKEIKDILAYLKYIAHPDDLLSLRRIINTPPRGIGQATQKKFFQENFEDKNIKQFLSLIAQLRKTAKHKCLSELVTELLKNIKYKQYLESQYSQKYYLENIPESEVRWQNIQELFSVLGDYDQKPAQGLKQFLEQTALLSEQDEIENQQEVINLMTIHAAKGLEFPIVFITGCEEGIFPHSKSLLDSEELEEERRLCYVGITRAKQNIYFTYVQRRSLYGVTQANPPSRFLRDVPKKLSKRIVAEQETEEFIQL